MALPNEWKSKVESLDWEQARRSLPTSRFRPMYDRAFGQLHRRLVVDEHVHDPSLRSRFLAAFDNWLHASSLNHLAGLAAFSQRDFIIGVTQALDDLHISFGRSLVVLEKEYLYHRRIRPDITTRTLESLQAGDVLVLGVPFAYYGDLHAETDAVLSRCLQLSIPVHVDAAWVGCLRSFSFNYDHPAIQSVAFSLSKGLGLGSHRAGVRYARSRHTGPVTVINDFQMELPALMWVGLNFMNEFGADYVQNRYGAAYELLCQRLALRPTKAIHLAFSKQGPVGVRSILRYLVDEVDEF